MEHYAGGRNVMLASGYGREGPSENPEVRWIFTASMWNREVARFSSLARPAPHAGDLRLATACRQIKGKGVEKLIQAAALLVRDFPGLRVDVYGDGPDLPEFLRMTKQLGLNNQISFHGRLSQTELWERLVEDHIFCLLSGSEGFPKAVLEAMACGLPVITSGLDVFRFLTEEGGGIALSDLAPSRIAEAIRECARPSHYAKLSEAARRTASRYTLEEWQKTIGKILQERWQRYGYAWSSVA
jgi:glycosyltransferase involved in cell wall biosynthesis